MKLYATLKNERGGKKGTGDDTRILVELSYKNKIVGTIGLYSILDDKVEGYRIVLDNEVIREEERQKLKDEYYRLTSCIDCKQRIETYTKTPREYVKCPSCGKEQ